MDDETIPSLDLKKIQDVRRLSESDVVTQQSTTAAAFHIDSPRPSNEIFLRRRSQGNAKKPLSPLRKSQTELCMTQHLKEKNKICKPLQTQSETTHSDVVIKPIGIDFEKMNAKESPPFGRLESHPANFYLLEQVIRSPGGGVELRTVLGVYTSKGAANRAAQWYVKENPNSLHQCDNTVELVTSQMPIDKIPTGNHSHETVELCNKDTN